MNQEPHTGRESKKENDLFFTCSLIEAISRQSKQSCLAVLEYLGRERIEKIYNLADVYHCDPLEYLSEDFIQQCQIPIGTYDQVALCRYAVPSCWDIGKIYKRLILGIAKEKQIPVIDALYLSYQGKITNKIHDFNSAFYYDNPQNILLYYLDGEPY